MCRRRENRGRTRWGERVGGRTGEKEEWWVSRCFCGGWVTLSHNDGMWHISQHCGGWVPLQHTDGMWHISQHCGGWVPLQHTDGMWHICSTLMACDTSLSIVVGGSHCSTLMACDTSLSGGWVPLQHTDGMWHISQWWVGPTAAHWWHVTHLSVVGGSHCSTLMACDTPLSIALLA